MRITHDTVYYIKCYIKTSLPFSSILGVMIKSKSRKFGSENDLVLLFYFVLFLVFETVFLCSPACPGTSSCRPGWPQTYRDLPASVS